MINLIHILIILQNLYFCLNSSTTLNIYIYNQEIPKLIVEILIQNGEVQDSKIYNILIQKLKCTISQTTYNKHKKTLLEDGIIKRREITNSNKKIPPTFYSLTDKGKKDYNLRILDIHSSINKNRALYQLLLFFECYKRSNLMTERQFKNFLKEIGIKFENMEKMSLERLKHIQQNIFSIVTNSFKTYNNISIGEFKNLSNSSKYYYVVLPGFTMQEFLGYLELIKKGKEPRPFSQSPTRLEIPYFRYQNFSKEEVSDAIELLKTNGIIKPILEIYRGEMRYDICNESVKEILYDYWYLHICDFHISLQRLVYNNKPSDINKEYMQLYFGKQRLNHKLALIYDLKKQDKEGFEKEVNEKYDYIEKLIISRNKVFKDIDKKSNLLKENDSYIISLVKEICLLTQNFI